MPLYKQWLEYRGKFDKLANILKEAEQTAFNANPHRYATPGHDEFRGKWSENFKKDHAHWYRASQPTASGSGSGALWCSPALPASQPTASGSGSGALWCSPALPDQRERDRDRQRRRAFQQSLAPTPAPAVPLFPSAPSGGRNFETHSGQQPGFQQPQFGFGFGAGTPASSQTQQPAETGARRRTSRPSATYTPTNDPDRSRSSEEDTQQGGQYDPNADWRSMGGW